LPLELFSQELTTSSSNLLISPSRDITPKKFKAKSALIFSVETRRLSASLEGLNNSPAQTVCTLLLTGQNQSHNFGFAILPPFSGNQNNQTGIICQND